MNPEITFADYQSIGTMETALSKHADEAFFDLSENEQKIAEKIFKCLTETDRENREIRRALTIDKLCAVAEADFSDVARIIDVFRREGRTFLMPPADVDLNENTLVDISHESLIRKWGRLKTWVEEEGQSSRTYRRLAEDALLHQQNKMGFWSDPELKDALEWRESFQPNETWAELYKETGERQYNASFVESMRYLDESEIKRDEEIAEEERQQTALRKYARNLRWTVVGLVFFSILTIGVAVFAVQQMTALASEKARSDEAFDKLKIKTDEIESKQNELNISLASQQEATKKAQEEKKHAEQEEVRADKQAEQAKLSEAAKQEALEKQKQLSAETEIAKNEAVKKEKEAVETLRQLQISSNREKFNRDGLIDLEQGEFSAALTNFKALLASYDENVSNNTGRWWALHNLGIVYSKLSISGTREEREKNFQLANSYYSMALGALYSYSKGGPSQTIQQYNEKYRCLVTTYRRSAQLLRAQAENAATETDRENFNKQAAEGYGYVLDTLKKEPQNAKQPKYPAGVWVELADTYYDLYEYAKAKKFYSEAEKVYADKNDLVEQVEVLKKWSKTALTPDSNEDVNKDDNADQSNEDTKAYALLEKAIDIQENKMKMNLSPVNPEIADSYAQYANPAYQVGNDGNFDPPPYARLSELIRKANNTINYQDYISSGDIEEIIKLGNTYIEVGKAERAEKLYIDAIEGSKKLEQQGDRIRTGSPTLRFSLELAELYQNQKALRNDQKAKDYFDRFAADSEKSIADGQIPDLEGKLFEKAGDYFFVSKDYLKAGKFYEYALQKIDGKYTRLKGDLQRQKKDEERSRNSNSPYTTAITERTEKLLSEIILDKAEVIVKTAVIDEKQDKVPEAEAKYRQTIKLISEESGKPDIAAAKVLIYRADFYGSGGDKEKATEIYNQAVTVLSNVGKFPGEKLALQIYIQTKLGDINSDDTAIAAQYYEKAVSNLKELGEIKIDTAEDRAKNCGILQENTRYTKNGKITVEYWIDMEKILTSWSKLKGVENADNLGRAATSAEKAARDLRWIDNNPD